MERMWGRPVPAQRARRRRVAAGRAQLLPGLYWPADYVRV